MNAATSLPALTVVDVSKRFGAITAVDHVSFELGEHELLALVGPSGCGKSTLLRMIAGLQPTESGSIALAGQIVDDGRHALAPERRRVGLVFQEHALFPHLSVAKNVAFGVRDETDRADARVREMLDVVGLGDFHDRYPHELSGGERQRVALARALAPRPTLMLLDEPFASLDPNLRAKVRDDVVGILRRTQTPAVMVTHDQDEALAAGDRIAVMRDGSIAQIDTPDRIFHAPSDRFVAAFMGEADFLRADDRRRDLPSVDDQPSAHAVPTDAMPDDTLVMVRPDDVRFEVDPRGSATVVGAEFRGSTWCYTLHLESGTQVRSIRSHLDHVAIGTVVSPTMSPGHHPVALPEST